MAIERFSFFMSTSYIYFTVPVLISIKFQALSRVRVERTDVHVRNKFQLLRKKVPLFAMHLFPKWLVEFIWTLKWNWKISRESQLTNGD